MELSIQERQLLADFRQLSPKGQRDLLQQLAAIKRQDPQNSPAEPSATENKCRLDTPEKRPEAASEPIFTE